MLRTTINNLFVWKFGTKLQEGDAATMPSEQLAATLAVPETASVMRSVLLASCLCAGKVSQQIRH